MHLDGTFGFGYNGSFGSEANSSGHGTNFLGFGTLTGSYYHPNFLNFTIQPYYNRSQGSAETSSLFSGKGVNGTIRFFSGSRFPGSFSFNKDLSSTDQLGIPGMAGFTTEGSSQGFTITWAALLPNKPTLEASFSSSGNTSTVLGATGNADSSSKILTLNSTYKIAGWNLLGNFNRLSQTFHLPEFLDAGGVRTQESENQGASTGYGITAMHKLPLSGSFSAGFNHSTYSNGDGRDPNSSTGINLGAGITPFRRFTVTGTMRYSTNTFGALAQSLVGDNNPIPVSMVDNSAHSLSFNTTAYFSIGHGLTMQGYMNHHAMTFQNKDYSNTQYGGVVSYRYSRPLLGMLYASFGAVDTANQQGNSALNLIGSLGVSRKFGHWDTSADFGYSQSVQTLIDVYSTSSYSYGGSLRRRINEVTFFSAAFRAAHSGLQQIEGNSSGSKSISANFSWNRYGIGASYAQSNGTTVLTPSGLLSPTPLAPLITNDFVLFNGKSYSVTATARLLRNINLTGNYVYVTSETLASALYSLNKGERWNARLEYHVRKLSVRGNYYHVRQGISSSGIKSNVINSYQIEITRWFNVF
ncbi:MAG: hypothetical protein ACE14M_01360 [Terriglobales bacterium]